MSEPGESDRAFLTRHGVPGLVKEALGRLGSQQPAEPIAFLAEFFSATEGRRADLEQARSCLAQADWQSPGYLFAVKEAFDCLRRIQREDCRVHAVCGLHCTQLMELLLRDAPAGGSGVLLQRLRLRPQATVQFGRFYSSVMCALAFKAYMADCAALYADAEAVTKAGGVVGNSGNNRAACACLLQLLDSALDAGQSTAQPASSLFARLDCLSPLALQESLATARPGVGVGGKAAPRQPAGPLSQADFLAEAAAVFIRRLLQ